MKPLDTNDKPRKQPKPQSAFSRVDWRWVFTIMTLSFLISVSMSYISSEALQNVGNIVAFSILLLFVLIGILFDIIGIASASATEKEFHSMAARKVSGAREAVWLSRNAEKVSSICNDVVGDICGIMSGAVGAIIIARLTIGMGVIPALLSSLTITGCIAALTIGGKAIGKGFGITFSVKIVFIVGRFLSILPIHLEKR